MYAHAQYVMGNVLFMSLDAINHCLCTHKHHLTTFLQLKDNHNYTHKLHKVYRTFVNSYCFY